MYKSALPLGCPYNLRLEKRIKRIENQFWNPSGSCGKLKIPKVIGLIILTNLP